MGKFLVGCLLLLPLLIVGCSGDDKATESITTPSVIIVPDDATTIQAGLDLANGGDTVFVKPGIYSGPGNRDLSFNGKNVRLVSTEGAAVTIISCGGSENDPHRAFDFSSGEGPMARVHGFTIRGGSSNAGGAIFCLSSSPTIANCVFETNVATTSGGAVRCKNSEAVFLNCTFSGNSAPVGSALFSIGVAVPILTNCLIVFNDGGHPVYASGGSARPILSCSDVFGNVGGDWVGDIADQAASSDNFSADPLLCAGDGNFNLTVDSPCAPANNACGKLIGALGVDCP